MDKPLLFYKVHGSHLCSRTLRTFRFLILFTFSLRENSNLEGCKITNYYNVSSSKIHWSRASSNRTNRSGDRNRFNLLITNCFNSSKPSSSTSTNIVLQKQLLLSYRANSKERFTISSATYLLLICSTTYQFLW